MEHLEDKAADNHLAFEWWIAKCIEHAPFVLDERYLREVLLDVAADAGFKMERV